MLVLILNINNIYSYAHEATYFHFYFSVCNPLSVGTYTGNFMDIAPSGSQYCRQDGVLYQDDLYPMATTLAKSYLSTPFR